MTEPTKHSSGESSPIFERVVQMLDIRDVWETLLERWQIFVVTLLTTMLLSLAYLFSSSPVYVADLVFSPATERTVGGLNIFEVGVSHYTPQDVFSLYKARVELRGLQKQFLSGPGKSILGKDIKVTYIDTTGESFERSTAQYHYKKRIEWEIKPTLENNKRKKFGSDILAITTIKDPENLDALTLRIDWRDPQQASALANLFADYANHYLVQELANNLRLALNNSLGNIRSNIEFQRTIAKTGRENQIKILEEAAEIADSLGYTEPVDRTTSNTLIQITPPEQFFLKPDILSDPPQLLREKRYFPMYQVGSVNRSGGVTTQGSTSPLYFRGSRVLRVEANFLRNRATDDPYIPELATLQEQLVWLESINIDENSIKTATYMDPSYPPNRPTKPNPTFIIITGVLFGLILGLLFTLSWSAFVKLKGSRLS